MTLYDTIIIGGGVAGLEAAQMLGRARRTVLVIDAETPRNRTAPHMHGVLGHDGTPPLDLLSRGREEVEHYGVTVTTGTVDTVDTVDSIDQAAETATLKVTCTDGTELLTRSVLVTSGIEDELPEIPGLAEHWGTSVFQCPYCHGWEVRDSRIGVLATSPMSFHHAMLVRQWTDSLTIFTTDASLIDELDDDTRARFTARGVTLVSSPVTEALTESGATESAFRGLRTQDGETHELDALALSPTPRPRDRFLAGLNLDRYEAPGVGSFLQTDDAGRTSHPHIWAAGNVIDPRLNVPAAVGQASMTAGFVNFALVQEDAEQALRD